MENNNRFYWLKLKRDFFKRSDIMIIENMPNGKEYILFYLKLLLESIDNEGSLRFSDTIPYNEEMLATITNTNIDIVRSAMKVFESTKMIEILDDETIFMAEVSSLIGSASNTDEANRQRRCREKKKAKLAENVTNCHNIVTNGVTNNNESKSIELEKEIDIELDSKKETKAKKESRFIPPSADEVRAYCNERGNAVDADRFVDYYASKGWMIGKNKMKDWKAAVRNWERKAEEKPAPQVKQTFVNPFEELERELGYDTEGIDPALETIIGKLPECHQ